MDKNLTSAIVQVLTEKPIGFDANGKHYHLYPMTLGKMYLTSYLIEALGINRDTLSALPFHEIIRVTKTHRDVCCRLIAYCTLNNKRELIGGKVTEREKIIANDFDDEDIATIVLAILKDDKLETITKGIGIDKEIDNIQRVNRAKDSTNTYAFGGKSIWGSLIDVACERYGWSLDYVLWGISYANLTLMLKDKITTIYLSDKEKKRVHLPDRNGETLSGDNRENVMRLIKESEENPI